MCELPISGSPGQEKGAGTVAPATEHPLATVCDPLVRGDSVLASKARAATSAAIRQHGVLTRRQVLDLGYSDSAIGRLIGTGRWQRLYRGVYLIVPPTDSLRARLIAIALRVPGRTWISHGSAAALWEILPDSGNPIEVTTCGNLKDTTLRVHRVAALDVVDRAVLEGVPVTGVERTLIDLAGVVRRTVLEGAVSEALRLRLTDVNRLRKRAEALSCPGRRGAPLLRKMLDEWAGSRAAESALELAFGRLSRQQGLPPGVRQFEVRERGRFVARVDVAYPSEKLAVELDGYRWHGGAGRWRADLARRNLLTKLGWRVVHLTWQDVRSSPEEVAALLRDALGTGNQASAS